MTLLPRRIGNHVNSDEFSAFLLNRRPGFYQRLQARRRMWMAQEEVGDMIDERIMRKLAQHVINNGHVGRLGLTSTVILRANDFIHVAGSHQWTDGVGTDGVHWRLAHSYMQTYVLELLKREFVGDDKRNNPIHLQSTWSSYHDEMLLPYIWEPGVNTIVLDKDWVRVDGLTFHGRLDRERIDRENAETLAATYPGRP